MTRYRFYIGHNYHTQGEAEDTITKLLHELGIKGATLYSTMGVWEGQQEPSLVVEIIEQAQPYELWPDLFIQHAKSELKQEAILFTREYLSTVQVR